MFFYFVTHNAVDDAKPYRNFTAIPLPIRRSADTQWPIEYSFEAVNKSPETSVIFTLCADGADILLNFSRYESKWNENNEKDKTDGTDVRAKTITKSFLF